MIMVMPVLLVSLTVSNCKKQMIKYHIRQLVKGCAWFHTLYFTSFFCGRPFLRTHKMTQLIVKIISRLLNYEKRGGKCERRPEQKHARREEGREKEKSGLAQGGWRVCCLFPDSAISNGLVEEVSERRQINENFLHGLTAHTGGRPFKC